MTALEVEKLIILCGTKVYFTAYFCPLAECRLIWGKVGMFILTNDPLSPSVGLATLGKSGSFSFVYRI